MASADFYASSSGGVWGCNLAADDDPGLNGIFGGGVAGYFPTSLTRTIPVAAAGPATVNLLCTEGAGNVSIEHVNVTALFVPGSY